jgi:hypothetical protein
MNKMKLFYRLIKKKLHAGNNAFMDAHTLISSVKYGRLTYLTERKLELIVSTCKEIEKNGVQGSIIEAGCALGGSSIVIAASKAKDRPFKIYDVFGMIPPPSDEDTPDVHERFRIIRSGLSQGIDGDLYYGYIDNLKDIVRINLNRFGFDLSEYNIDLIEGLLQETLYLNEPIALAHIDVDWHDPVLTSLERISSRLSTGGSIIVDDYYDWGGCKKAVDRFLNECGHKFTIDDSAGSRKLTLIS